MNKIRNIKQMLPYYISIAVLVFGVVSIIFGEMIYGGLLIVISVLVAMIADLNEENNTFRDLINKITR